MLRATIAAAALVLVSVLAITASAAGKPPALMRVLKGGWFQVSVRGEYTMHWSVNLHDNCFGDPAQPEFLDGQASERMTFASRRPARAFLFETFVPGIRHGSPIPTLVLSRRFHAVGQRLGPNDFAPLKLATPADWVRSLSGTYQECGDPVQQIVAPGCGSFRTPRFISSLSPVSDTRRYRGKIVMSLSELSHSNLPEARCQAQTYAGLPFADHTINFLQDSADVGLRCPPPAAVVSSSGGTTLKCHLNNRDNGFLPGVQETLVVTFRRLR
jgi:hypothetical protein